MFVMLTLNYYKFWDNTVDLTKEKVPLKTSNKFDPSYKVSNYFWRL